MVNKFTESSCYHNNEVTKYEKEKIFMQELLKKLDLNFILEILNTIMGFLKGLINAGEDNRYGSAE